MRASGSERTTRARERTRTGLLGARTGLLGALVLAAALVFSLTGPVTGTARAAVAVAGPCQGHKIKTYKFSTGRVTVFKGSGFICALTYAENPGRARKMSVTLQARGHRAVTNSGVFRKYAGPVSVRAAQRCVMVTGSVGRGSLKPRWLQC
ncbi:hypothetical protein GUY60_23250 [Streptomyces sp. YC537]|uniref:Secreted protein n=1 Tax=Streptomyces boluensis TaxID=1775135 RepID=A0A964UU82_9ACTN|nr:hypothetical protein [Streptomyces boluensis]